MPNLEDCFQIRVFGDPGMEMMPECRGCMCYKHGKTYVFEWFHFFYFFTNLVYQGLILCAFLLTFGDLWGTFWRFLRVLETGLKFDDF